MKQVSSLDIPDIRVQPVLIVLSALLIPILTVAFIMLYLFPQSIGADYFAWPINPAMSSMMLGATYLGGAFFFVVVLVSRKWRHVWLGFIPVSAFAGTLGIATLLHWDRFVHERFAFQLWAFLYFTVPLILPILWYRNHRLYSVEKDYQEHDLNHLSRWSFGALGIILTIAGMLLLFFPQQMINTWPWTLTPLTARVMSSIFILPGLVGLSLAYVGSWESTRFLLQAQAFTIILMLIASFVARDDFDWNFPGSWLFIGGLSLVLILIVYTFISMRAR
jgi:hypothetical protein